jgi:BolA protein
VSVRAELERRLAALAPERLELEDESARHAGHAGAAPGGNTHWRLTIVAQAFAGKLPLERHRMVYAALGDLMHNPIHAIASPPPAPAPPAPRPAGESDA